MTADAAADFNKEIWHLAGQAEVSGVVITLSFPVSKWRGEVRGASVKLSAFISHGRIQGQKWLRTAGLDVMDEEVCLWVKLPLLWATEIMCDKCIFWACLQVLCESCWADAVQTIPRNTWDCLQCRALFGIWCLLLVILCSVEMKEASPALLHVKPCLLSPPFSPCPVLICAWRFSELEPFCAFTGSWVWAVRRTAGAKGRGRGWESSRNWKEKLESVLVICMELLFSITLEKDPLHLLPAGHCKNRVGESRWFCLNLCYSFIGLWCDAVPNSGWTPKNAQHLIFAKSSKILWEVSSPLWYALSCIRSKLPLDAWSNGESCAPFHPSWGFCYSRHCLNLLLPLGTSFNFFFLS